MKRLICIVAMVMFSGLAMAANDPLVVNEDMWVSNMYDHRTYDESHPNAGKINSPGGWYMGISIFNPTKAALVDRVEIVSVGGPVEQRTIQTTPDVYDWLGSTNYDYNVWIGHKLYATAEYFEVFIYAADGTLIPVQWENGDVEQSILIYPELNVDMPPVCKIKKLAIRKNGELKVKFTAPADSRADQIRIRVFDDAGNGLAQFKYFPPYQIVQKDGDIIPDMMKVFIPAEYAGHNARIEYRTSDPTTHPDNLGFTYMCRGITFFKLPEPETPEVPLARCFTLNGTIYNRVNSMGVAWDGGTLFAQNDLNIGTAVSYQICANEEGGFTAELRSFPEISAIALSDVGNPTDVAFNTGDYAAGWLLVGNPGEYVQVVFNETPPKTWAVGDTFEVIHSIHQQHTSQSMIDLYGPDWYSRIRTMGEVTSIDPVEQPE
jgi:hypothetical protein